MKRVDPQEKLKETVKETAKVSPLYGGFEILISKPDRFPWYQVIHQLIEIGHEIWVDRVKGRICITSKPKV
jgi:hypothetical protein